MSDRGFWLRAALLAAVVLIATGFEQAAWGWHFAREEAPGGSAWHWLRGAIVAVLAFALVFALRPPSETPLSPRTIASGWVLLGLAAACLLLLAASPAAFQRLGGEDGPVEWVSALALFAASLFAAIAALRRWRRQAGALLIIGTAGVALLTFVMGGEEVSWFQRVIGFATPEAVAARNWQGEFNFHNFHTDITELALYSASALFLMAGPLLRETLSDRRWLAPLAPLLPDRAVAALAAPMLVFTYSHWNLLAVQAASWIGLAACALFARTSTAPSERRLWLALTAGLAVGQALMLLLGPSQLAMYDSSEYRELFLACGLAVYAWRQARAAAA